MDAIEHLDKSLVSEGVVRLMLSEYAMTATYSHTYCLAWLLLSPILYEQVVVRIGPSFPFEVSRLEDALIKKHKVATTRYNVMKLLV